MHAAAVRPCCGHGQSNQCLTAGGRAGTYCAVAAFIPPCLQHHSIAMSESAPSSKTSMPAPTSLRQRLTRPGLVIAEGWIERAGRSTCFAEGRLLNAAGDVIAKAKIAR
eukprot:gene31431-53738_t